MVPTGSNVLTQTTPKFVAPRVADDRQLTRDHRPLRPRRPALHLGRARLHGTRPSRRRAALPGSHRARGKSERRGGIQRAVQFGWTKTFTDPRLCAAIVDRLTYKGQIIETGTSSYRLAHARANRNAP